MSDSRPVIADASDRSRFEADLDGATAGFLEYRRRPGRITLVHTQVDPAFEGRGVGSAIARFALEDARTNGLRVRVACPFVAAWLRRHREYDDLVEPSAGSAGLGGSEQLG
ncbi:MAG TPA: GNAT family N-acetyltransferase [Candidatus Limnocylindrales bacterium]|nr:GNAT family N-acetyltransferase [Candidatus Limnocylindrales bacterium]